MDEMGMSGSHACIPKLIEIAESEANSGYIRLKAVEALGRLKATAATHLLVHFLDARQVWRWEYAAELRVAAAQAYSRIDPVVAMEKIAAGGIDRKELVLAPTDPEGSVSVIRQRRYARLKLSKNLTFSHDESPRKFQARRAGIESRRRNWRRRSPPGAGLSAGSEIDVRRSLDQGAGNRTRRAPFPRWRLSLWIWIWKTARGFAAFCWTLEGCLNWRVPEIGLVAAAA